MHQGTVETQHLTIDRGDEKIKRYWTTGGSGKPIAFVFCEICGSGLWNEPQARPQWICIKSGTIDDVDVRNLGTIATDGSKARSIGIEFFVKDRVQYVKQCEGAKQEDRM